MFEQDPSKTKQLCLMVTVQNGYPMNLHPNPEFWGKLASSLTSNPQDFDVIEDAVKNVYCQALQSVMDNNNDSKLTLAIQNLDIPLQKLKQVICPGTSYCTPSPSATSSNSPRIPNSPCL